MVIWHGPASTMFGSPSTSPPAGKRRRDISDYALGHQSSQVRYFAVSHPRYGCYGSCPFTYGPSSFPTTRVLPSPASFVHQVRSAGGGTYVFSLLFPFARAIELLAPRPVANQVIRDSRSGCGRNHDGSAEAGSKADGRMDRHPIGLPVGLTFRLGEKNR